MNSPVRLGVSPAPSNLSQRFSVRGFEALFPHAGTLGCTVCLTSQFFLLFYLWDSLLFQRPPHLLYCLTCPGPPAAAFLGILSAWLPVSSPPTGLDECFFFNSLVAGLPYSSIFWQLWLLFVFKFVVVLLLGV